MGIYMELKKSWANAGARYAINEYIYIKFEAAINRLIISNGYICYNKPDLFLKNSRLKSIIIFDADTNDKLVEFELSDTAGIQVIEFNQEVENIKIKISDIYKGTAYKNTCINFILGEYFIESGLGPQGSDVY